MRKLFYSLLILSICFVTSHAEFFYLKSGKVISGKVISEADDSVTVTVSGTGAKRKIMLYEIEEITKAPKPIPSIAAKTESPSNAEQAKTQFTSDFKQEKAEGSTYVKDNKSGVLVFNVQETVVEKQKPVAKTATKPVSKSSAEPKPVEETAVESDDDDFDAALFLLGNSSSNNTSSVPVAAKESAKAVNADTENKKAAKPVKKKSKSKSNEEFDAALFLLSNEEPVQDPLSKKEKKSKQASSDYYDPAIFLLEGEATSKKGAAPKSSSKGRSGSENMSQKPDNETFLALAFDLQGVNIFSGKMKENGVKSSADLTENSDYGISLSAEQYGYVSRFAAVGLGIGFQFKRGIEESPGRFGFMPLYAAFKMRFVSEEDYHFYAVAHLGYNFLLANSSYLNKSETNGGLYYAGGLGASYNRYVFQMLYSVNNASIKYSNSFAGDKVDKDVMYSKVGFYIGYLL